MWIDRWQDGGLYKLDSSFHVVPGLAGVGVSFKSVNYPDHFIRHSSRKGYLAKFHDSDLFKRDASWIVHQGLASSSGISLESVNFPGEYMLHYSYRIRIARRDGSSLFRNDATWIVHYLVNNHARGEWKLVYGNNNAASSGTYQQEIERGVTIGRSSSVTVTNELGWSAGYSGVKAMFQASGMRSVSKTSSDTWEKSHTVKHTYTLTLKKGEPVYFWQWYLYATTSDGHYITVKTNLFHQTLSYSSPPAP